MFDSLVPSLPGVGGTSSVQGSTATKKSAAVAEPSEDFGSMLTRMATDTIDTLKNAEAVSISGIKDKASVQQVVESVMAAEESLQTALAIRDKVVSAYLEVSRMAI
jgi:flagellar hook-basal body complex protein FliE